MALIVGAAIGYLGRKLLSLWNESGYLYQMHLAVAVAYLSFTLAEHYLHVSGVLAVFASALAFFYTNQKNNPLMQPIWGYAEEIANASLFFLLGVAFASHDFSVLTLGLTIFTISLMFFGRVLGIAGTNLILPKTKKLTRNDQVILNLSGVRGAISIALILSINPQEPYREAFLCLAFVMVLTSLSLYPIALQKFLNLKKS
jgi:CPA1 family monovalent cation:H+ antiporter